jgi:hypothetical protein
MKSDSFISNINFPANASGDTYTILLLTPPDKDTELSFGSGKNSYSTTITQVANAILTFTPSSVTPENYDSTIPTVTSTASPVSTAIVTKVIDWDIINEEDDAYGFGLRLIRQPIDTDWYFKTTETVNRTSTNTDTVDGIVSSSATVTLDTSYIITNIAVGDFVYGTGVTVGTTVAAVNVGSNAKVITLSAAMSISSGVTLSFITANIKVVVDDLTDLATGMYVTSVSGTNAYLSGTPIIADINDTTNTLTLSTAQAFVDNTTLTLEARGSNVIQDAIGANIDFSSWNSTVDTVTLSAQFKKTVRATGTNAEIALDNTYGISGGSHLRVKGVNVNNSSTNKVLSVNADVSGNSGTITVQLNQTTALAIGTILKFFGSGLGKGSRDQLQVDNSVIINSHPSINRTIYLNLDNFITIGTES